jgi:hypothetical protein
MTKAQFVTVLSKLTEWNVIANILYIFKYKINIYEFNPTERFCIQEVHQIGELTYLMSLSIK